MNKEEIYAKYRAIMDKSKDIERLEKEITELANKEDSLKKTSKIRFWGMFILFAMLLQVISSLLSFSTNTRSFLSVALFLGLLIRNFLKKADVGVKKKMKEQQLNQIGLSVNQEFNNFLQSL